MLILLKTVSAQGASPLSTLLTHLKQGLKGYQNERTNLKEEDAQEGLEPDPLALTENCPDKHEKCPFWAFIVSPIAIRTQRNGRAFCLLLLFSSKSGGF